jgi:hypothetical protein
MSWIPVLYSLTHGHAKDVGRVIDLVGCAVPNHREQ